MSAAGQPIIVVKKKGGHAGHHGGAWKVAYADFVTAMMAFFLVMWLVNQSKPVKAAIGGYFRDPGAFSDGGTGVLPGGASAEPPPMSPSTEDAVEAERHRLEDAVAHMKEGLDQVPAFNAMRSQIEFTVTPEGLRIDLVEKAESSFFDSGSASPRGETERILGVIAPELNALAHEVVIEGHTDSRPYADNDRYSNWELSADRANAARRVMERKGLQASYITAVRGLANRQLRVPEDPMDARNRRVSILVQRTTLPARAVDAATAPAAAAPAPAGAVHGAAAGEPHGAASAEHPASSGAASGASSGAASSEAHSAPAPAAERPVAATAPAASAHTPVAH